MKHLISRFHLAALLLVASVAAKGQNLEEGQIAFAYTGAESAYGTNKAETYNVAIHLHDAALVGAQVVGLRIPMNAKTDASDITGWLTSELKVQSKKNVVDGQEKTVSLDDVRSGFIDLTFDTPYTLTADGIYAGYTFTVNSKEDDASKAPVAVGPYVNDDAFYFFTNKTFMKWKAYGQQLECASALQVVLSGGNIASDAVGVSSVADVNIQTGQPTKTKVTVVNHGYNGVKSFECTYTLDGQTFTRSVKPSPAVKSIFGARYSFDITIPAMERQAPYPLDFTVTKVNDADNADPDASIRSHVYAFNVMPKHRAVLEEYTGTWCGWCPRGFVGMEEMNRLYPEDFIGIAYHNNDAMAWPGDYPSHVSSFPAAWLDRVAQTDAYSGDSGTNRFAIDKTWLKRCEALAPADIDVVAAWTDETHNVLRAVASVTSPLPVPDCKYQLCYILVADSLSGSGSRWTQSNYYSGASGWGTEMEFFCKADKQVEGLVFNDVIVARSSKSGIEGSLPRVLEAETTVHHTYDFDISRNSIIQDRSALRVVALLIDPQTGAILNANKTSTLLEDLSAVTAPQTEAPIESIRYFDLAGRRITLPRKGVVLEQTRRRDGSVQTAKRYF